MVSWFSKDDHGIAFRQFAHASRLTQPPLVRIVVGSLPPWWPGIACRARLRLIVSLTAFVLLIAGNKLGWGSHQSARS